MVCGCFAFLPVGIGHIKADLPHPFDAADALECSVSGVALLGRKCVTSEEALVRSQRRPAATGVLERVGFVEGIGVNIRSQPGDSQDSGDEELAPRTGPCAQPRSTLAGGGGGLLGGYPAGNMSLNGRELVKQSQPTDYNQSVLTMQKSVTITVTPQRSNSMDLLNFEEKRQLIASSLSLSDILHVSPAAAHVAKEVAASTVIGKLEC
uniref:Uncharacterized protein n=1 Tax=Anopheles stephensi TaxID=30069 RepID=A0A182Y872_ANOST